MPPSTTISTTRICCRCNAIFAPLFAAYGRVAVRISSSPSSIVINYLLTANMIANHHHSQSSSQSPTIITGNKLVASSQCPLSSSPVITWNRRRRLESVRNRQLRCRSSSSPIDRFVVIVVVVIDTAAAAAAMPSGGNQPIFLFNPTSARSPFVTSPAAAAPPNWSLTPSSPVALTSDVRRQCRRRRPASGSN